MFKLLSVSITRMQHVYWIDWNGQIKRARLNGTDSSTVTNEIVAYELTGLSK